MRGRVAGADYGGELSTPPSLLAARIKLLYQMKVEDKTLFLQIFDSQLPPHIPPVTFSRPVPAHSSLQKQPDFTSPRLSLVRIQAAVLADALAIYEWREQTDYPIARCRWRKVRFEGGTVQDRETVLLKASQIPQDEVMVEVETEWLQPLTMLAPLSLAQLLHCFKQALVGFERLFTLFGGFEVHPQMICVDSNGRLKVWLSLALDHNTKVQYEDLEHGEVDLVDNLRQLFSALTSDTATSRLLFANLTECRSFLALFKQLDSFTEHHKLLPARLVAHQRPTRPRSPPPPRAHHRIPRFLSPGRSQSACRKGSPISWKAAEGKLLSPSNCLEKKQGTGRKESDICSKDTTAPALNLVRIDKARKGSGSNFIFKSAGTLSAAHQQLVRKNKNSQICAPPSHIQSLPPATKPQDSLLQNFERLFEEQEPTDYLSVSINIGEQQLSRKFRPDRLKNYGREVCDSIISAPRPA